MEQEETVDYNIRKTWYNISKMYSQIANEYMGSMSLGMIILNIDIIDGTPSTQLGPNMGMESTSLSRSLNKLEKIGVIERKIDPNDKRKSIIHLTALGKHRREIAKNTVINFNKKIQSEFTSEEMKTFFKVLNKINQSIQKEEIGIL